MLWIETDKPWARLVIHQSLTTTVVKIVRLSKSTLSPDELTCSVRSKRRDQNQSDNRDIHDKLNPLYTLSTMINIFHDIYLSFSFLIFDYIFFILYNLGFSLVLTTLWLSSLRLSKIN